MKRYAARIGPIVCELDGPRPILNKSNALTNKKEDPGMVDWTAVIVLRGEPMTSGFVRLWRHVLAVMMLVAATAASASATAGWLAYQRSDFAAARDRKSTRLNSSHSSNSYAVFCLKKHDRET